MKDFTLNELMNSGNKSEEEKPASNKQSRTKPVVGQTLYSLNVGNAARNCETKLTPVVVTKVGRKYFYTHDESRGDTFGHMTYNVVDWREKTNYSAHSKLYESKQTWLDEREAHKLCRKVHEAFEYGHNRKNLSLETLRAIDKLIKD